MFPFLRYFMDIEKIVTKLFAKASASSL